MFYFTFFSALKIFILSDDVLLLGYTGGFSRICMSVKLNFFLWTSSSQNEEMERKEIQRSDLGVMEPSSVRAERQCPNTEIVNFII